MERETQGERGRKRGREREREMEREGDEFFNASVLNLLPLLPDRAIFGRNSMRTFAI